MFTIQDLDIAVSDLEDLALIVLDLDLTLMVLGLIALAIEDLVLTVLDLVDLGILSMEGLDMADSDLDTVVFTDLSFTIVIMVVDSAVVML